MDQLQAARVVIKGRFAGPAVAPRAPPVQLGITPLELGRLHARNVLQELMKTARGLDAPLVIRDTSAQMARLVAQFAQQELTSQAERHV